MSVIKTIPRDSQFVQTSTRFAGNFNVPQLGAYDFGTPGNTGVVVADINADCVYLLSALSFSATIPEADFLLSVSAAPTLTLRKRSTGQSILTRSIPLVNYIDGMEINVYFVGQKNDAIVADFSGVVTQTSNLVGIPTIYTLVALTMYQIQDTGWKKRFYEGNATGGWII